MGWWQIGTWMVATAALLVTMPFPAAAYTCTMSRVDKAWLEASIEKWRSSERHMLKLAQAALPAIFAVDAGCTLYLESQWTRALAMVRGAASRSSRTAGRQNSTDRTDLVCVTLQGCRRVLAISQSA